MTAQHQPAGGTGLIIDVATSGLQEDKHVILETAVILFDLATLDVIDTHSGVIKHGPESAAALEKAPAFHKPLVDLCTTPDADLPSTRGREGFLLAGPWTTATVVVNRALDFDLKFLAKHMPTLHRALPRHRINLESMALLMASRGLPEYTPSQPRTYRAPDDALEAYLELRHLLGAAPL